jgi:hypothetical protein
MKTVDLSHQQPTVPELLELAGRENLLLRTPDGRAFVLAEIDDFDKELELIRQNQELMDFLEERSREPATRTLREVRDELGLD